MTTGNDQPYGGPDEPHDAAQADGSTPANPFAPPGKDAPSGPPTYPGNAGQSPYGEAPYGGQDPSPYAGQSPYGEAPYGGSPPSGDPGHGSQPPQYGAPPPGYGGMPYVPPGYYGVYAPPPQRTNGLAIASLVTGIVGCFYIMWILALVFGFIALAQIKRDGTGGRGMAIAGIVLGFVWAAIVAIVVISLIADPN